MQNKTSSLSLPTVGILGGGQLSVMMSQAYQSLGGQVIAYGESTDEPAASIADRFLIGAKDDKEELRALFEQVDVVTLESEFFDAGLLIDVSATTSTPVLPDPNEYRRIEDKLSENIFFQKLGIPVADFFVVEGEQDLLEKPGFLKLSKGGYDGIGTQRVANLDEAKTTFKQLSKAGMVLFEEEIICLKELSLIAVSSERESTLVFYPLVETIQEQGTCRYVVFPAGVSAAVEEQARAMVAKVMNELGTSGLFAFEFFLTTGGELILNESAPRPHNSGHITLDSMDCSQFENHMRAIAGLELISPTATKESATMVNLLATQEGLFDESKVLSQINDPQLTVNLYGKKYLRIKRKMGHINLWGEQQRERADALLSYLEL